MNVRIGRKRSSAGLVVHLAIGGNPCACGQRVNTTASAAAATARLCKRGFTAQRITAAQQANNYSGTWNQVVDTILAAIVESRRTPAERAASAAKFARTAWAQDMAAAAADTYEDQIVRRRRTWAEIRADFQTTHQPALLPAAA